MKDFAETMKHLQKATTALAKLQVDHDHPWKMISDLQGVLDSDFWENLARLNRYSDEQKQQQTTEDDFPPLFIPNMDIFLTDHKVIVSCEAPGLERDSLEISLTDRRNLLVKGRIREHAYVRYRVKKERFYGQFARQIKLPAAVSSEGMRTTYNDGLLELHFLRKSTPPPKQLHKLGPGK